MTKQFITTVLHSTVKHKGKLKRTHIKLCFYMNISRLKDTKDLILCHKL